MYPVEAHNCRKVCVKFSQPTVITAKGDATVDIPLVFGTRLSRLAVRIASMRGLDGAQPIITDLPRFIGLLPFWGFVAPCEPNSNLSGCW